MHGWIFHLKKNINKFTIYKTTRIKWSLYENYYNRKISADILISQITKKSTYRQATSLQIVRTRHDLFQLQTKRSYSKRLPTSQEEAKWWEYEWPNWMPKGHQRSLYSSWSWSFEGKCFISGIPLLVLFNSGAIHSFMSYSCVEKLKLFVSSLNNDLVEETPTSGSVLTSVVSLNCLVEIFDRKFLINLIFFIFKPNWCYSGYGLVIFQPCLVKLFG